MNTRRREPATAIEWLCPTSHKSSYRLRKRRASCIWSIQRREYDSLGAGFHYNKISNNLKTDIAQLTSGNASASDESCIEVFDLR
jgi:hypothetical protein